MLLVFASSIIATSFLGYSPDRWLSNTSSTPYPDIVVITHDASVRRMHKESPLQNPCMRCLYQAIICLINSKHAQWLHKSAIDAEISVARAGQGCRIDQELCVRVPLPWFMWVVNRSRGRDSGMECAVTILLASDANGRSHKWPWN